MGFSPDLKEATEHALLDMIDFLVQEKDMTRDDAYMLSSVAVDLDITQLVDGNVGSMRCVPDRHRVSEPGVILRTYNCPHGL
jgi:acetamidase/formamidase